MDWRTFLLNLIVAVLLGAAVGLERQITRHATGIRTCVLVCVGACLFTSFPYCISGGDITRAAMQIVSGVGFLGNGIIFKDGSNVRGLNTAATIWCTAGIGIFTGAGLYLLALLAAGCIVIVNIVFSLLNRTRFLRGSFDDVGAVYRLSVFCASQEAGAIRSALSSFLLHKQSFVFYMNRKKNSNTTVQLEVKFFYEGLNTDIGEQIAEALSDFSTVQEIKWERMD